MNKTKVTGAREEENEVCGAQRVDQGKLSRDVQQQHCLFDNADRSTTSSSFYVFLTEPVLLGVLLPSTDQKFSSLNHAQLLLFLIFGERWKTHVRMVYSDLKARCMYTHIVFGPLYLASA